MATRTPKNLLANNVGVSGAPWGNKLSIVAAIVTLASGALSGGDSTTPIAVADKVRFGFIPAGTRLEDAIAIVSNAFPATSTLKIGFEYVDGIDHAGVPQDDDYFFAALNTAATGRTQMANTGVRPIVLPKDAYVVGVVGGAGWNEVGVLDLLIDGSVVGQA
jgi:hypothetical protein